LNILFTFRSFEQLALALKNRVALEFFTVLNMYFLSFRIFEQLALALKTEFSLEIFNPGGRLPPDPPPRTPVGLLTRGFENFMLYAVSHFSHVAYTSDVENVTQDVG